MSDKLLTTREVAVLLHVEPATVRRYIAKGLLVASKVGTGPKSSFLIHPADVSAALVEVAVSPR